MLLAKVLFAVAAAVLYAVWAWGAWAVWGALSWWALAGVLALYLPIATWLLYLAGMAVDRANDEAHALPELSDFLARLIWPIAAIHNCANNAWPMMILFGFDPPRELATTKRLNRYVNGPDGWRRRLALFVREQLLNVFDWRGVHT